MKPLHVYLAIGVLADGEKQILGLWEETSTPQFWHRLLGTLRLRGIAHIQIAVSPSNEELRDAIHSHFPDTVSLTSPPHTVHACVMQADPVDRASLNRRISELWHEPDICSANAALKQLALSTQDHPQHLAVTALQQAWPEIESVFALPLAIRKLICGVSASEALRNKLGRRCTRIPTDFSARETILPRLANLFMSATSEWRVAIREWRAANLEFSRIFAPSHRSSVVEMSQKR